MVQLRDLQQLTLDPASSHSVAIIDSSEDAIVSKTLGGIILTWNAGACHVYGYSVAEAVGQPMTLLLPPDRLVEESEILERICRGDRVEHFETTRRTKWGELIHVSLAISPIRNESGEIVGASHVARDITERKRLDEQLRHFASIIECSDDAIVSKTLQGKILTWNSGAERVYGYSALEAIGQPMAFLLPEDRPHEEKEILQRIALGERVQHFETVRRKKDGDRIDVSLTISPIRDSMGHVAGASHVGRDITERNRIEGQLRRTQKLESLGVLAGGVAHDFNNLLTGILGNASLAIDTLPAKHSVQCLLREVVTASERAANLTRQLLAYAGKGRFVIEPVNLSGLVREISTLIHSSIPRNVQLRLELRDELPAINADGIQLQQLVMNLVLNAAESVAPDENGTVLVTTSVQDVDEHYLRNTLGAADLATGRYISLEVHDTGCGMDDATVARIFEPFFTTKFTGRGLGLAAVQGIVQSHKGRMKVYSRQGKGTTFKVLFPAMDGAIEAKSATPPHLVAKGMLILVIDDEDVIRRTSKSMLEFYGYTVIMAENGKDGVDLFRLVGENVAAVLLDVTMPVMGGEEAFGLLKVMSPGLKVILSSGYNEIETLNQFGFGGIAGFLQKPYSSLTLAEKMASVLSAK